MPFVSHAQNFEDVILNRALKGVDRGLYVDIGASHPKYDSVSLAFHRLGWKGVHVEPLPAHAAALRRERPGDTVLEVAVSEEADSVTLYEVGDSEGISTCDPDIARRHQESGYALQERKVPCLRLSDIFDRYVDGDVHWLKIDVEGWEAEVIRSWGGSSCRPWIVLVESTVPRTAVLNFAGWEESLTALGYRFAYFDGLNRFYVSEAHPELLESFNCGPNFFDDFIITEKSWMWQPEKGSVERKRSTLKTLFKKHRPHFGPVGRRLRNALIGRWRAAPAPAPEVPGVREQTVRDAFLRLKKAVRSDAVGKEQP